MNEVKRETLESLREYSTDGGMRFPAEVLIVSGVKAAPTIAKPLFQTALVRES